ncbi:hypothetical protein F8M41_008530 [Gigaspora margarita]|uniref:Uncharacterized protein n=1 Tax=Gigaspora margarita TaxID=4874 RepID=A0A8H4B476_GIGMA|nr:hypothetical protein F8M41_008530 [Gigaspora margarita]
MSITYLFFLNISFDNFFFFTLLKYFFQYIFSLYNVKTIEKTTKKPLKCNTSECQQQEPLIVIKPLTDPLPLSETLSSTGLHQTGTFTTPNSPIQSALHSPIRSLLHTPAQSSPLARPSTPVHSTTSPKKSTFIRKINKAQICTNLQPWKILTNFAITCDSVVQT